MPPATHLNPVAHLRILRSPYFKLGAGRSKIHRRGVFALQEIPAGRKVIEYTGKKLTFVQGMELRPPKDRYLVRLSDKWLLDGSQDGSGAELVNHCCTPNLEHRRENGHIYFYSRRRIPVGEELTIRYDYPIQLTRVPCRCGSPKCRGTLRYLLK